MKRIKREGKTRRKTARKRLQYVYNWLQKVLEKKNVTEAGLAQAMLKRCQMQAEECQK